MMAQGTPVPGRFAVRQLDFGSLLSEGVGILTSVVNPEPTATSANTNTATNDGSSSPTDSANLDPIASGTSSTITYSTVPFISSTRSTDASSATSSFVSSSSSSSNTSTASAASATAGASTSSSGSNKNTLAIILGSVLGTLSFLLLLLVLFLCLRRRRKRGTVFGRARTPDSDNSSFVAVGEEAAKEPSESTARSTTLASVNGSRDERNVHPAMREQNYYPPLPPPHQISSLGRRHSEYAPAYIPNDPFEDASRAMLAHDAHTRARSRPSLSLNPVREVPERGSWEDVHAPPAAVPRPRAASDPRNYGRRRYTFAPGSQGPMYGSGHSHRRSIPRKPVPGPDGWFEREEVPFRFSFPHERRNGSLGSGPLIGNPVNGPPRVHQSLDDVRLNGAAGPFNGASAPNGAAGPPNGTPLNGKAFNNLARAESFKRGGWSGSPDQAEPPNGRPRPLSLGGAGEGRYQPGPY